MLKGRIQYITHPRENFDDLSWVHRLHENGVRWIQLRIKEADLRMFRPDEHYLAYAHEVAFRMRAICGALEMTLTINDLLEVCFFSGADGLHVGQEDEWPDFETLSGLITGGTAHSVQEMKRFPVQSMTYFGTGPLRQTDTKTTTKPSLDFSGYKSILNEMSAEGIEVPVFAIGGIKPEDVRPLLESGVYGVAVSGAIFHREHSAEAIRAFTKTIEEYEAENC